LFGEVEGGSGTFPAEFTKGIWQKNILIEESVRMLRGGRQGGSLAAAGLNGLA
jgi:hypothetical protein